MDISVGLPPACQHPFCARKPQTGDNTPDALAITSWYAVAFVCHKNSLLHCFLPTKSFRSSASLPSMQGYTAVGLDCRLVIWSQLQDSALVFTETH